MLSFLVGQFLKKSNSENSEKSDFFSFLINNLTIITILLAGYLLNVAAILWLPTHRNYTPLRRLKLIPLRMFFLNPKRLLAFSAKLALVFLSFRCFAFFNLNFLSSSIKTDKVIIKLVRIDSLEAKEHLVITR